MQKFLIPRHIAIIMDGNGRWAEKRKLARFTGHRVGIKRIEEIVEAAKEFGIEVLTLFAFSTENWQRPAKEVELLLRLLDNFLEMRLKKLVKNDIRLCVIGRKEPIPDYLWNRMKKAQEDTKDNKGLILNIAFNYGSRAEIVDATRAIALAVKQGSLDPKAIDEQIFTQFLYTKDLPDPDLLIRTSGEERISNFLLWQISYAELYFTEKFWPDFDTKELRKAIAEFKRRKRRFGVL